MMGKSPTVNCPFLSIEHMFSSLRIPAPLIDLSYPNFLFQLKICAHKPLKPYKTHHCRSVFNYSWLNSSSLLTDPLKYQHIKDDWREI